MRRGRERSTCALRAGAVDIHVDRRGLARSHVTREIGAMRYFRTPPRLTAVDYIIARTYLITFCTAGRKRAFSDPVLASIACRRIRHFRDAGHYWLYAYTVMPDHVHAVIRARNTGLHLSRIVATLRSAISIDVRRYASDFSWQRGYHERILHEPDDVHAAVDYVLENPVRAALVSRGERYRFSGVVDMWG